MDDQSQIPRPTCIAFACPHVALGICVVFFEGELVYAGPIKDAPEVDQAQVFFNPSDHERMKFLCGTPEPGQKLN